ncbi:MAG: flagellar protein FlgN [Vampirovibrionia bacterium]
MEFLASKLENNLSEQLKFYNQMNDITKLKKELIIKGDAESLAELDRRIESIACQVLELEQKRFEILDGKVAKESKLSDFISQLDEKISKPLDSLRRKLKKVMSEIQRTNEINVYLINNSIKWIEHSVATIANVLAPESAAYNFRGKVLTNSPYTNFNTSTIIEHDA